MEYDKTQNVLVGLVAPLEKHTGMPKVNNFPASTANEIYNAIQNNEKSSIVQVILVQPNNSSKINAYHK